MISAENSTLLPLADQRVKKENNFGDRMIKRLLNSAISKNIVICQCLSNQLSTSN